MVGSPTSTPASAQISSRRGSDVCGGRSPFTLPYPGKGEKGTWWRLATKRKEG